MNEIRLKLFFSKKMYHDGSLLPFDSNAFLLLFCDREFFIRIFNAKEMRISLKRLIL